MGIDLKSDPSKTGQFEGWYSYSLSVLESPVFEWAQDGVQNNLNHLKLVFKGFQKHFAVIAFTILPFYHYVGTEHI